MSRVLKIKLVFLLLCTTCTLGNVRKVPSDYPTIQVAIDDCNDGDTVLVAPGTYTGDGNRDIDFKGKAITVKSEEGPKTCIIDCNGTENDPHRGFRIYSQEGDNTILEGFTVVNGYVDEWGGGIFCGDFGIVKNSIVTNSRAINGGGICITSNGILMNCIITNNTAFSSGYRDDGIGGGIIASDGYPSIINCTIYGNRSRNRGGGLGCAYRGTTTMKNCIIIGNRAGTIGGDQIATSLSTIIASMKLIVRNCCIQSALSKDIFPVHSSAITIEDTIFLAEPYFAKPGYWANVCDPNIIVEPDEPNAFWIKGDYHLKSQAGRWDPASGSWVFDDVTSPCIDAGDPNSPVGDEPFPNGGIINMGAYGGTAEASKSYFGEPLCETIIAGDINGDCKVDLKDLALLSSHWLEDRN